MDKTSEKILRELKDRADLQDLIHKYATGIDLRDWKLYRSIFDDEVEIDFSSYSGQPKSKMKGDDWVAQVAALQPGFDATQHQLSNFTFDIKGDTAVVTLYMQAEHFIPNSHGDASHTLGGYYTHKIRRTGKGWKIYATTLNVFWSRGNRQVYELALERNAARQQKRVTAKVSRKPAKKKKAKR